jgi:MFS transporter, putative metabolite:H+ symporter
MLVLDRVGRRATLVGSMLGSAVCAVGFAFARSETTVLVASCLLSAVSVGSWNALDAMSVEYFPSGMRSSAMGTLAATGRLGSILGQVGFGLFVSDSVTVLLVITSILLGVGAVAGLLLPFDTAGKALDDAGDVAGAPLSEENEVSTHDLLSPAGKQERVGLLGA